MRQGFAVLLGQSSPRPVPEVCGSPDRSSPVGLGISWFLVLWGERRFSPGPFLPFLGVRVPSACGAWLLRVQHWAGGKIPY